MRFVPAILVSLFFALGLVAIAIPWGVLHLDVGPVEYYAWDASLRFSDIRIPNILSTVAGFLVVIIVWLRTFRIVRVPWLVASLLAAFGVLQAFAVYRFFDTGEAALRLTNFPATSSAGLGSVLAGIAWASVALVSLASAAFVGREARK